MGRGPLSTWVVCGLVGLAGCRDASSGAALDAAPSAASAAPAPPIEFGWSTPSEGLTRARTVTFSMTSQAGDIGAVDMKATLHETFKEIGSLGTPVTIWVKFDSFASRGGVGGSDLGTSTSVTGKSYTVLSGRTAGVPDVIPGWWADREQAREGDAGFAPSRGSDAGVRSAEAQVAQVQRFYGWIDVHDLTVIPVPFRVLHVGDTVPELVDALRLVVSAYDPGGADPVGAMFRGSVVLRSADATVGQFCFDFGFLAPGFIRPNERRHRLVNGCVGVRRADGWITRVEAHVDEKVEGMGPPEDEEMEQWVVEMSY